jgi:hypothetical protein
MKGSKYDFDTALGGVSVVTSRSWATIYDRRFNSFPLGLIDSAWWDVGAALRRDLCGRQNVIIAA